MPDLDKFRRVFEEAFYERAKMKTGRFFDVWTDLELISDEIAGPLYSIYEHGQCDYVFREKLRFPGIRDADDLLNWWLGSVKDYRKRVQKTKPRNDEEREDQTRLLQVADKMEEASRLGHEIVKQRELA